MEFLANLGVNNAKIDLLQKRKQVIKDDKDLKFTLIDGIWNGINAVCLKFSGIREKSLEEAEKFCKDLQKVYQKIFKKISFFEYTGKKYQVTLLLKDHTILKPGLDFSSGFLEKLYRNLLKSLTSFHYFSVLCSPHILLSNQSNHVIVLPSLTESSSSETYSSLMLTLSELYQSSSDILSQNLALSLSITSFDSLQSSLYSCYSSLPITIQANQSLSSKLLKINSNYQLPLSHSGAVTGLAFNVSFSIIATGSISGEVQLWDVCKNEEICMIKPLKGAVYFLEFTENSQILLAGGADQTLGLLSLKRKKILYKRKAHAHYMNCLATSPDSRFAITGGDDAVVQMWDLQNCSLINSLKGHAIDLKEGLNVLSCDVGSKNVAVTGGADGYVKIWRLEWKCLEGSVTGRDELVPFTGHKRSSGGFEDFINAQLMNTEKRYDVITCVKILNNCQFFLSAGEDGIVRFWDLVMKEKIFEISAHRFGRFSGVRCLEITKKDDLAISGGVDGCICFIDLALKAQVFHQQIHISCYNGGVSCLAITPNDQYVIAGGSDSSIVTVEISSKIISRHVQIHSNLILGVKTIDEQRVISYGLDGFSQVWDPVDGRVIFSLPGQHKGLITAVLVNHLIGEVVTGAFSGHLRFWKIDKKKLKTEKIAHSGSVSFLALALDGKLFLSGGSDGNVKVWHSATRLCVQSVICCQQSIINARMDSKGKFVIAAGHKRKVYLWNLENGEVEPVEKYFRMIQIKRIYPEFAVFIEYLDY